MVDWCDRKIAVSASLGLQKYGAKDEGVDLTAGPMKPCIKLSAYVLILLAMRGALSRHSGALSKRHNERVDTVSRGIPSHLSISPTVRTSPRPLELRAGQLFAYKTKGAAL